MTPTPTANGRALIFDFDGLIVDSEQPDFQSWQEIYRAHGATLTLADWLAAVGYVNGFDPKLHLARRTGRSDFDWPALDARRRRHHAELMRLQPVLPGVFSLMQAGRAAGWKIGVASNSTRDWVEPGLERLGVRPLVDAVLARESVVRPKPAPDVYRAALRALVGESADPARSFAFEDSQPGVESARAAGLRVVVVPHALTLHQDLSAAHHRLTALTEFVMPD